MSAIHHHYDQLTEKEHGFVDYALAALAAQASGRSIRIYGDDTIERVADALARAIIESRK